MCGIGGVLKVTPPGEAHVPIPEEWLDLIDESIAHRGPDGAGRFRDTVVRADGSTVEVALVHRRLAIIDIEDGAQPMVIDDCPACAKKLRERAAASSSSPSPSPSGAGVSPAWSQPDPLLAIVFNGCIYNHRELRAELEAQGHVFKTDHSDTEVIGHLYSEMGPDHGDYDYELGPPSFGMSSKLDGMYSFSLWDASSTTLLFGRDSFGEKPLYSYVTEDCMAIAFSSAISGVTPVTDSLARRGETRDSKFAKTYSMRNRASAADWITLGFGSRAPLNDLVRDVDLTIRPPEVACGPLYTEETQWFKAFLIMLAITIVVSVFAVFIFAWMIVVPLVRRFSTVLLARRTSLTVSRLDSLLDRAVASRLESDVPLGCFLSGGVDSSLIAYYAKQHLPDLTTLTVRMPDDRYDESRYAELVAEHLGTNHITLDCDGQTAGDDLVHLIMQLGLPFGDSSILPTYWLCREARKHVKVALSGDGADELFYGYDRYRAMRYMPPLLRYAAWLYPIGGLDRSDPKSKSDRKARFITAARHGGYTDLLAIFPTPDRRKLLGRKAGGVCRTGLVGTASMARDHDLGNYLPSDILRKTDTASMAVALEVRAPFLEKALVEAALATPARVHMAKGEGKHLLKELARKHLPREIVDRPKQGFAIPISDWLRTDFGGLRTLMMAKLNRPRPFGQAHDVLDFNLDFVQQMIDEHDAAGDIAPRHSVAKPRDHGQRLFALMSLAIWADSLEI